ncbi:periplasmic nitrate reductase, NapE protein [Azospirillum fermentarium]|uniref:periplasmic nitrate reductase, NapE protein n=1 Tax=Azospirillum fermentarium TaxID=1233114 RepID=UPI002225BD48|nr:periplasmic nitrate reductase, NapE protein [Azospirillum fermentarium]
MKTASPHHPNGVPPSALSPQPGDRRRELSMFVLLAFVIWPFLAVAVVGGYGFAVWIGQMIFGPPGPPPV